MTLFIYEAIDRGGRVRRGMREADNQLLLRDDLLRESLTPLKIKAGNRLLRRSPSGISEAGAAELAADLGRFIRSGLSIVQALSVLESAGGSPASIALARRLRERVVAGEPLSVALESAGGQTGRLLQALARAGETTGRLPEIFEGGAKGLRATAQLKRKMLTLTVYPAFVLLMAFVAMGVFAFAVLPALEPAFEGMGDKLPGQTRLILQVSRLFRAAFPASLVGAAGFAIAVAAIPRLRKILRRLAERVSLSRAGGGVVRDVVFSGLAQRLSISLGAGSPLLTAYRVSIAPVSVGPVRAALDAQEPLLRDGKQLSAALADIPFTPDVLVRLARVGENSNELHRLLGEASDTLALRAQERAERLLAVLTPVLVVAIGAFIGVIVIVVFQGLLSITEVIDL